MALGAWGADDGAGTEGARWLGRAERLGYGSAVASEASGCSGARGTARGGGGTASCGGVGTGELRW